MVEEALVADRAAWLRPLRRVPEEAQGGERQVASLRARAPAALDANCIGRKRVADRGDAAEGGRRPAIRDQAILAVHRVPEPAERALFDILVEGGKRMAGRAEGGG